MGKGWVRDGYGTCMGQVWDGYGTGMGQVWDRYGTGMGQVWEIFYTVGENHISPIYMALPAIY